MNRNVKKFKWPLLAALLTLWLVGVVGVGNMVYHNPGPGAAGAPRTTATISEVVASVFTMIGGLSIILTLYFNIWQSIETQYAAMIENTYALVRSWDDAALLAARKLTRELADRHGKITPDDLIKEINDNPELRQSVVLVFNFIELVGYSLRNNRVDSSAIRRILGPVLININTRFDPWIKDMDKKYPSFAADLEEHVKLLKYS